MLGDRPVTRIALHARKTVSSPHGTRVTVIGGRLLDGRFLEKMRIPAHTHVELLDGRRTLIASAGVRLTGRGRVVERSIVVGGNQSRSQAIIRLKVSDAALQQSIEAINIVALGLISGGLFLALMLGALARRVTRPLEKLAHGAEAVANGNLQHRIDGGSRDELGQLIASFNRMTNQLSDSREQLKAAERVAAWREIARRIAHEIKNPLFPIQTAIETLQKVHRLGHPAFEEVFNESTTTILEEVERLKRIVSEFSDFARMPKPALERIEINELIKTVTSLYRDQRVPIELQLPEPTPVIDADRQQLTQVLVNLIKNAQDALRGARVPLIVIRVVARDEELEISVLDNGCGIAAEIRDRLFTPYVTTKSESGGTGLGLAIVHKIVSDHGGRIDVRDGDPAGAVFQIRLPSGRGKGAPDEPVLPS
jgi:nitrogen fixation/metabolism regulation signal transduction histidine kinase